MKIRISWHSEVFLAGILAVLGTGISRAADASPANLPVVRVVAPDQVALEGASSGAFTLIRYGSTAGDLAVNYLLSGTASNGVDYLKLTNTTTIKVGFAAANIVVTPILNPTNTGTKRIVLTLLTNANYQIAEHHGKATVKIVDDSFNNQPPTVTLLTPTNGSVFTYPATISLKADASDLDDNIAKVTFYANDDALGSATNSPFTLVWTNARPAKYALFARATDVFGKSTLSSAVHITVEKGPRPPKVQPPVVTILSPANGAMFGVKSNVPLAADATSTNGPIVQVQLYGDEHILGGFTNKPYSLTWSNVPPGRHTVTARATDSAGIKGIGYIRFTITNAPPVVTITSPIEGATFVAHTNITLKSTATDLDDNIARVSFYANSRFVGRVTQSPFEFTWTNAPAGKYRLSAIATDEFGEAAASKSVTISVK